MRKIFLNLMATFVAGVWTLGIQAQEDVTDTYLTNPSFEGAFTEFAKPNTDRAIYQPEGWTAVYTGGEQNDMTYVATNMVQDGYTWTTEDAGNAYFIRQRWSKNCTIGLSQELANLPAGTYKLEASIAMYTDKPSVGNLAGIYAELVDKTIRTNAVSGAEQAEWATYAVNFNVLGDKSVTIGLSSVKVSDKFKSGYDSFKLTYMGFDRTTMLETLAERKALAENLTGKMNGTVATTLATAIANAGATDISDEDLPVVGTALMEATVAAQSSIEEYVQLQAAIETAKILKSSYPNNETVEAAEAYAAAISVAEQAYEGATATAGNIETLNAAAAAYKASLVPVEGYPLDYTDKIVNPSADNGTNGWTIVGMTPATNSGEHYTGTASKYFDKWDAAALNVTMSQEIKDLPAGEYIIKCVSRGVVDATLTLNAKCGPYTGANVATTAGNTAGAIWETAEDGSAYKLVNGGKGYGWGTQSVAITVVKGQPLKISYTATSTKGGCWFSADEFELLYIKTADVAPAFPTTNVAQIEDGELYVIKNVATGKYLGDGPVLSDYVAADDAYKFYITAGEEGQYLIHQLSSDKYLAKSGNSGWNVTYYAKDENSANDKWLLTNEGEVYKIQNTNNTSKYLGTNNATSYVPYYDKTTCTEWKILSASEFAAVDVFVVRENLLNSIVAAQELSDTTATSALYPEEAKTTLNEAIATAFALYNNTETVIADLTAGIASLNAAVIDYRKQIVASNDAPADFTFMLVNPAFDNNSREGWTGDLNNVSNGVAERYNGTTDFYQVVEGLPSGKYGLVAQGFYRAGAADVAMAAHEAGTEVINANLYMNEAKQAFRSLYDEPKDITTVNVLNGYVDGLQGANIVFDGGYYQIPEMQVFVSDGKIKLGVIKETTIDKDWACFDNFKLVYYGYDLGKLTEELEALIADAKGLDSKMQVAAKQTLTDSIAYAEEVLAGEQTEESLQVAIDKMKTAITAANNSIAEYAKLEAAITTANVTKDTYADKVAAGAGESYETAISTAQEVYDAATVETTADAVSALDAAAKAYLFTQPSSWINPLDVTAFVVVNANAADGINGWTCDNAATNKSQHWDGTATTPYFEQNVGWANDSWSMSMMQEMTNLPAGKYAVKVAMRASAGATLTMTVEGQTVTSPNNSDMGGNITTDGTVAAIGTEGVTFANNNLGRGWEWRTIYFELAETKTVAINIAGSAASKNQWCSFGNFSLAYNNDASEVASVELEANPASGTALVTSDALDNVKLSIANKIDGVEYTVNQSATAQLAIGEDVVATGTVVEKDDEIVIEWSEGTVELIAQASYTITVSENAVSYLRDGATVGNEALVLSYTTTADVSVEALIQSGIKFNGSTILNPNGANLKVYAVSGNLVLESNESVNLSALNKGVYLLNIEGQASPVKFVVK